MKAVAMKCTQEQFDSIKDRIPLSIVGITNFETNDYLTNNFRGHTQVSNISLEIKQQYNREVLEHFDGDYFLECCGIEQTWKGSDLQYKRIDDNGWFDCLDYLEYRLKPKTNLDADIEALQRKANELGIKLTILIE